MISEINAKKNDSTSNLADDSSNINDNREKSNKNKEQNPILEDDDTACGKNESDGEKWRMNKENNCKEEEIKIGSLYEEDKTQMQGTEHSSMLPFPGENKLQKEKEKRIFICPYEECRKPYSTVLIFY